MARNRIIGQDGKFNISPADNKRMVEENGELLRELGYVVEDFGPSAIVVRTAPVLFGKVQEESFFHDLVAELRESRDLSTEMREKRIITMSCKRAVKAHDALPLGELLSIVQDLAQGEMPFTCPHTIGSGVKDSSETSPVLVLVGILYMLISV